MNFYIYAYYEPEMAEPFYIGKGQGRRMYDHLEPNQKRDHFHNRIRAILARGEKPEIQVLADSLLEVQAFDVVK